MRWARRVERNRSGSELSGRLKVGICSECRLDVGLDPGHLILPQSPAHTLDGLGPILGPDAQLGHQRVVVRGDGDALVEKVE